MKFFKAERIVPAGFALLSGLLLALSFPRSAFYLLAWVALVPLFFAIRKQSAKTSFLLGWLAGLCYFGLCLSWLATTLRDFGGLSTALAFGINLLLIAYLALYPGIFCALLRFARIDRDQTLLLLAPVLWVLLEYAKGHLLTGFPWLSLAYSQFRNLSLIQIADFGSIYSVSFVIVLINSALYLLIVNRRSETFNSKLPLFSGLLVLLSTFSYGEFRLSETAATQKNTGLKPVSVAVIQGNIAQTQKWDRAFQKETVETYLRLSNTALKKNRSTRPDFIVWPESALPFIFGTEAAHEKRLFDFVNREGLDLLVGAPSMRPATENDSETDATKLKQISLFNSAFLLNPEKGIAARYDKIHLVPFGEYVPFSKLFYFANKIVSGISDFSAGKTALVMSSGDRHIGVAICFEVIFPELVRRVVKNGATIMTTITNDAWFANSAAPYQHFSMLVFRAIENRVPFARAANTGISGFVDAGGRIIAQSALDREAVLLAKLSPRKQTTFYTLQGDLFVALCAMIASLFFMRYFYKRHYCKRRKRDVF